MQNRTYSTWCLCPKTLIFGGVLLLTLGLAAALSSCSDGSDRDSVPQALQADLRAVIDGAVANEAAPGVVVQIAAGERGETWSAAAGVSDVAEATPISTEMRIRGGSIMKTFIAAAVLQAVEAGQLGLDDAITLRLPASVASRIANAATINVRMLLGHRSGIADWVDDQLHQAVAADPAHLWTLDEILARVSSKPPTFAPDEGYSYSNTGYVLLGEILSYVTHQSWRDAVRAVIAQADLHDTTLPEPGDLECPPPCAHGYIALDGTLHDFTRVDPSMAGASGGHALITTMADLTQFFRRLRSGALFKRESTLDAMLAFEPAVDPESRFIGYGLGVAQIESDGAGAIGHLGTTAGYQSFMLYVPATDRYVSGYINRMGNIGAVLIPILSRAAQP